MSLRSVAPGGDSAGNERASLAHMRSRVMPTQEKFDPVVYLGTVHWVRPNHTSLSHATAVPGPALGTVPLDPHSLHASHHVNKTLPRSRSFVDMQTCS